MGKTKSYLFILISLLMVTKSQGQDLPFSISIGGGYGFGTSENSVETYVNTKVDGNTYFTENKKFSLGYGYSLNGTILYSFHENMGIGLGFNYHFPKDVEFNEINAVAGVISEKQRLLSAKRFSILPAFQLNTDFEKLNTYMQIGISINFTSQKLNEVITVDTNVTEYFWEYSGDSKFGFYAQCGISYTFSKHASINFSIAYEGYSFSPDENNMILAKYNGNNISLDSFDEIEKSVVYEDWVSDQYNQFPESSKPLSLPRQTFNYNSLTIGLALSYRF